MNAGTVEYTRELNGYRMEVVKTASRKPTYTAILTNIVTGETNTNSGWRDFWTAQQIVKNAYEATVSGK